MGAMGTGASLCLCMSVDVYMFVDLADFLNLGRGFIALKCV